MKISFLFKKLTAYVVVIVFLVTQVSLPTPVLAQSLPIAPQISGGASFRLELPKELGSIDEIYFPQAQKTNDRLVVFIQAAHGNSQAQKSIASILESLTSSYGRVLVAMEGAWGPLQVERLKIFSENKLNDALAQNLLEKGELTGGELFAIQQPDKTKTVGVDDPELYRENLSAYRKAYSLRGESLKWLSNLSADLKVLKNRIFSKELKEFDHTRESFHKEILSTHDYLVFLSRWALDRAIIDLEDPVSQKEYPVLTRILALKNAASHMENFESKLKEEVRVLKEQLTRGGVDASYLIPLEKLPESLPKGGSRTYFENLFVQAMKCDPPVDWNQFPALRVFSEYSILQEEVDGVRFFKEIRSLEDLILNNLGLGMREKLALDMSQDLTILERLFRLEASKEEIEWFSSHRDLLKLTEVEKRMSELAKEFTNTKLHDPRAGVKMAKVEEAFATAQRFYELAIQRDQTLLKNTLSSLAKENLSKAVLITGGFHSQGIRALMREEKIPYLLISPRIKSEFTTDKYEKIMMGDVFSDRSKATQYQKIENELLAQLLGLSAEAKAGADPFQDARFFDLADSGVKVLAKELPKPIDNVRINRHLGEMANATRGVVLISGRDAKGDITVLDGKAYRYNVSDTGYIKTKPMTNEEAQKAKAEFAGKSLGANDELFQKQELVQSLGLSIRLKTLLNEAGIHTVAELLQKSDEDLLKIKYFGNSPLQDLKTNLRKRGLKLKRDESSKLSLESDVRSLNLPPYIIQALEKSGIRKVSDLVNKTEKELLAISGFGPASLERVLNILYDNDLKLRSSAFDASLGADNRSQIEAELSYIKQRMPELQAKQVEKQNELSSSQGKLTPAEISRIQEYIEWATTEIRRLNGRKFTLEGELKSISVSSSVASVVSPVEPLRTGGASLGVNKAVQIRQARQIIREHLLVLTKMTQDPLLPALREINIDSTQYWLSVFSRSGNPGLFIIALRDIRQIFETASQTGESRTSPELAKRALAALDQLLPPIDSLELNVEPLPSLQAEAISNANLGSMRTSKEWLAHFIAVGDAVREELNRRPNKIDISLVSRGASLGAASILSHPVLADVYQQIADGALIAFYVGLFSVLFYGIIKGVIDDVKVRAELRERQKSFEDSLFRSFSKEDEKEMRGEYQALVRSVKNKNIYDSSTINNVLQKITNPDPKVFQRNILLLSILINKQEFPTNVLWDKVPWLEILKKIDSIRSRGLDFGVSFVSQATHSERTDDPNDYYGSPIWVDVVDSPQAFDVYEIQKTITGASLGTGARPLGFAEKFKMLASIFALSGVAALGTTALSAAETPAFLSPGVTAQKAAGREEVTTEVADEPLTPDEIWDLGMFGSEDLKTFKINLDNIYLPSKVKDEFGPSVREVLEGKKNVSLRLRFEAADVPLIKRTAKGEQVVVKKKLHFGATYKVTQQDVAEADANDGFIIRPLPKNLQKLLQKSSKLRLDLTKPVVSHVFLKKEEQGQVWLPLVIETTTGPVVVFNPPDESDGIVSPVIDLPVTTTVPEPTPTTPGVTPGGTTAPITVVPPRPSSPSTTIDLGNGYIVDVYQTPNVSDGTTFTPGWMFYTFVDPARPGIEIPLEQLPTYGNSTTIGGYAVDPEGNYLIYFTGTAGYLGTGPAQIHIVTLGDTPVTTVLSAPFPYPNAPYSFTKNENGDTLVTYQYPIGGYPGYVVTGTGTITIDLTTGQVVPVPSVTPPSVTPPPTVTPPPIVPPTPEPNTYSATAPNGDQIVATVSGPEANTVISNQTNGTELSLQGAVTSVTYNGEIATYTMTYRPPSDPANPIPIGVSSPTMSSWQNVSSWFGDVYTPVTYEVRVNMNTMKTVGGEPTIPTATTGLKLYYYNNRGNGALIVYDPVAGTEVIRGIGYFSPARYWTGTYWTDIYWKASSDNRYVVLGSTVNQITVAPLVSGLGNSVVQWLPEVNGQIPGFLTNVQFINTNQAILTVDNGLQYILNVTYGDNTMTVTVTARSLGASLGVSAIDRIAGTVADRYLASGISLKNFEDFTKARDNQEAVIGPAAQAGSILSAVKEAERPSTLRLSPTQEKQLDQKILSLMSERQKVLEDIAGVIAGDLKNQNITSDDVSAFIRARDQMWAVMGKSAAVGTTISTTLKEIADSNNPVAESLFRSAKAQKQLDPFILSAMSEVSVGASLGMKGAEEELLPQIPNLIRNLSNGNANERYQSTRYFADIIRFTSKTFIAQHLTPVVPPLVQNLSYENSRVRLYSLIALTSFCTMSSESVTTQTLSPQIPVLIRNLSHENPDVQIVSTIVLTELVYRTASTTDLSKLMYRAPESFIAEHLIPAISPLIQNLSHKNSKVQTPSAIALRFLFTCVSEAFITQHLTPAVPPLIQNLSHENSEVRFQSALALTALIDRVSEPFISQQLAQNGITSDIQSYKETLRSIIDTRGKSLGTDVDRIAGTVADRYLASGISLKNFEDFTKARDNQEAVIGPAAQAGSILSAVKEAERPSTLRLSPTQEKQLDQKILSLMSERQKVLEDIAGVIAGDLKNQNITSDDVSAFIRARDQMWAVMGKSAAVGTTISTTLKEIADSNNPVAESLFRSAKAQKQLDPFILSAMSEVSVGAPASGKPTVGKSLGKAAARKTRFWKISSFDELKSAFPEISRFYQDANQNIHSTGTEKQFSLVQGKSYDLGDFYIQTALDISSSKLVISRRAEVTDRTSRGNHSLTWTVEIGPKQIRFHIREAGMNDRKAWLKIPEGSPAFALENAIEGIGIRGEAISIRIKPEAYKYLRSVNLDNLDIVKFRKAEARSLGATQPLKAKAAVSIQAPITRRSWLELFGLGALGATLFPQTILGGEVAEPVGDEITLGPSATVTEAALRATSATVRQVTEASKGLVGLKPRALGIPDGIDTTKIDQNVVALAKAKGAKVAGRLLLRDPANFPISCPFNETTIELKIQDNFRYFLQINGMEFEVNYETLITARPNAAFTVMLRIVPESLKNELANLQEPKKVKLKQLVELSIPLKPPASVSTSQYREMTHQLRLDEATKRKLKGGMVTVVACTYLDPDRWGKETFQEGVWGNRLLDIGGPSVLAGQYGTILTNPMQASMRPDSSVLTVTADVSRIDPSVAEYYGIQAKAVFASAIDPVTHKKVKPAKPPVSFKAGRLEAKRTHILYPGVDTELIDENNQAKIELNFSDLIYKIYGEGAAKIITAEHPAVFMVDRKMLVGADGHDFSGTFGKFRVEKGNGNLVFVYAVTPPQAVLPLVDASDEPLTNAKKANGKPLTFGVFGRKLKPGEIPVWPIAVNSIEENVGGTQTQVRGVQAIITAEDSKTKGLSQNADLFNTPGIEEGTDLPGFYDSGYVFGVKFEPKDPAVQSGVFLQFDIKIGTDQIIPFKMEVTPGMYRRLKAPYVFLTPAQLAAIGDAKAVSYSVVDAKGKRISGALTVYSPGETEGLNLYPLNTTTDPLTLALNNYVDRKGQSKPQPLSYGVAGEIEPGQEPARPVFVKDYVYGGVKAVMTTLDGTRSQALFLSADSGLTSEVVETTNLNVYAPQGSYVLGLDFKPATAPAATTTLYYEITVESLNGKRIYFREPISKFIDPLNPTAPVKVAIPFENFTREGVNVNEVLSIGVTVVDQLSQITPGELYLYSHGEIVGLNHYPLERTNENLADVFNNHVDENGNPHPDRFNYVVFGEVPLDTEVKPRPVATDEYLTETTGPKKQARRTRGVSVTVDNKLKQGMFLAADNGTTAVQETSNLPEFNATGAVVGVKFTPDPAQLPKGTDTRFFYQISIEGQDSTVPTKVRRLVCLDEFVQAELGRIIKYKVPYTNAAKEEVDPAKANGISVAVVDQDGTIIPGNLVVFWRGETEGLNIFSLNETADALTAPTNNHMVAGVAHPDLLHWGALGPDKNLVARPQATDPLPTMDDQRGVKVRISKNTTGMFLNPDNFDTDAVNETTDLPSFDATGFVFGAQFAPINPAVQAGVHLRVDMKDINGNILIYDTELTPNALKRFRAPFTAETAKEAIDLSKVASIAFSIMDKDGVPIDGDLTLYSHGDTDMLNVLPLTVIADPADPATPLTIPTNPGEWGSYGVEGQTAGFLQTDEFFENQRWITLDMDGINTKGLYIGYDPAADLATSNTPGKFYFGVNAKPQDASLANVTIQAVLEEVFKDPITGAITKKAHAVYQASVPVNTVQKLELDTALQSEMDPTKTYAISITMMDASGQVVPGQLKAVSSAFAGYIVLGNSLGAARTFAGSFLSLRLQDEKPAEFLKLWSELFTKEIAGGNGALFIAQKSKDPASSLGKLTQSRETAQPAIVFTTSKASSLGALVTQQLMNPAQMTVLVMERGGFTSAELQKYVGDLPGLTRLAKRDVLRRIVPAELPSRMSVADRINEIAVLDEPFMHDGKRITLKELFKSRLSRFASSAEELAPHRSVTADQATIADMQKINPASALTFISVPPDVQDTELYLFVNLDLASQLARFGGYDNLPDELKRCLTRNQANQLVLSAYSLGQFMANLKDVYSGSRRALQSA